MTEFVRGGSCDRKSRLLRIVLDYPTTRSNSRASGWLGQRNPTLPVPAETRLQKSGRVRSLGRTSFAFITIVKGPGQKEVAREWKILRS